MRFVNIASPLDPRTNRTRRDDPKRAIMYHYILHATLSGFNWPSLYRVMFHFMMVFLLLVLTLVIYHYLN